MDLELILKKEPRNISKKEREILKNNWIVNWCWWNWWFKFDKLLKEIIKSFDNYIPIKWEKLFNDLQYICYIHDLDFYLKKWFIRSNLLFTYRIYKKTYWTKWIYRILFFMLIFSLISILWKKYY